MTSPSLPTYTREVLACSSRRTLVRQARHSSHAHILVMLSPSSISTHAAGQDATNAFFGLHRHEVLLRPQYARLQIGVVASQKELIKAPSPGDFSEVPYGEPAWLLKGYHSPYYTENHREFQKVARKFFDEVVYPDAVKCEENGKRISQDVLNKLWCVR